VNLPFGGSCLSTIVRIRTKLIRNKLLKFSRIPSIFDVVLGARVVEVRGRNFDPALAKHLVTLPQQKIVFARERTMANGWVQEVPPSMMVLDFNRYDGRSKPILGLQTVV